MSDGLEYVQMACMGALGEGCDVVAMCKVDLIAVKPEYEHKVREQAFKRMRERLEYEHNDGRHLRKQERSKEEITMSKLWLIEVDRELEDKFVGHIRQDEEPTEEEVTKWLEKEHCITYKPDYERMRISEVKE